jgi:hypothetical protein
MGKEIKQLKKQILKTNQKICRRKKHEKEDRKYAVNISYGSRSCRLWGSIIY